MDKFANAFVGMVLCSLTSCVFLNTFFPSYCDLLHCLVAGGSFVMLFQVHAIFVAAAIKDPKIR